MKYANEHRLWWMDNTDLDKQKMSFGDMYLLGKAQCINTDAYRYVRSMYVDLKMKRRRDGRKARRRD